MRIVITSSTALKVACLLAPGIGSAVVYAIAGSAFYAILALVCATATSWALIRYVLIEPQNAKYLTASTVIATGLFSATAVALSQSSTLWQVAYAVLRTIYPELELPDTAGGDWAGSAVAIAILLATYGAARLILGRGNFEFSSARKPTDLTDRQLNTIRRTLTDHLDRLDEELRFFDFRGAAIDPKLEELSTTSRYANIRSADKLVSTASDGTFIVVKGEPGSGKSVMLRNLTRRLLDRFAANGKLPVLLNLKDWHVPEQGTPEEVILSLDGWIRAEYRARAGARPQAAADEEFSQLYAEGGLIFLFDSFDENVIVNMSSHNGSRIKRISRSLADYIRGSGGCVGVVFSRDYKAPSAGWIDHVVFGVRPFSDGDVKNYIRENSLSGEALIAALFGHRIDLYAMAKTPLLLALIVDFCNRRPGELPATEFDVFDNFVTNRLESAIRRLEIQDISSIDVSLVARKLARSLTAAVSLEPQLLPPVGWGQSRHMGALRILREARLIRGPDDALNFSHKRFQEYFRVLGMLEGEEAPPSLAPGHIDDNRDVLNLYAQICPLDRAEELASQAHENLANAYANYIETDTIDNYETIVLTLRFLKSAFRNRPQVLNLYKPSVRRIIVQFWNSSDIMKQKHAVEQLNILPPATAARLVRLSMEQRTNWLRRVALWQARFVFSLQPWLGRCVAAYFSKQEDLTYVFERSLLNISSAMSSAALIDRIALNADGIARGLIISLFIATLWLNDPLIGTNTSAIVLFIYVAYAVCEGGDVPATGFEFLIERGFNAGLSGFLGFNVMFCLLWNGMGAALNPSNSIFVNRQGAVWVSLAAILAALFMLANNFLARRRDELDELGDVNPLAPEILMIKKPTMTGLAVAIRGNWFLFLFVIVFIVANLSPATSPALIGLVVAWFLVVFGSIGIRWLLRVRESIFARTDRPKVIRFSRHFSGRRSEISTALGGVRTNRARIDMLIAADARSADLVTVLRDSSNTWPGGQRPSYGAPVDGYLAILDERWWGLA